MRTRDDRPSRAVGRAARRGHPLPLARPQPAATVPVRASARARLVRPLPPLAPGPGASGARTALDLANAEARGPDGSGNGVYLGSTGAGRAWSGRERSTLVLGPSRSGKTSSIIVPNVLVAPGPVLSTSTKADVLHQTLGERSRAGWCMLFDPSGSVDVPEGVHRIGWSPVAASAQWDDALRTADAMVRTARGRTDGMVGAGPEGHWAERASALLAPLLHAAALDAVPMRTVLRWVDRHDGARALDVLAASDDPSRAIAADVLAGILTTDDREQSGIWSTASGVLSAYRSTAALASTEPPFLDPAHFCAGRDTLYVCSPGAHQQALAPLVVGMLAQVRDAAYQRARDSTRRQPPVLFALDEAANIAPLPDLPAIVSEGAGQGLLTLACLQDLSQARARWGSQADAFVSLFGTSVVLGGIADMRTLDALSALSGDHEVRSRAVGQTRGLGGRQVSTNDSVVLRRRLPVDVIARGVDGCALTVDARNRMGWVRLTPAHASWPWCEARGLDRSRDRWPPPSAAAGRCWPPPGGWGRG